MKTSYIITATSDQDILDAILKELERRLGEAEVRRGGAGIASTIEYARGQIDALQGVITALSNTYISRPNEPSFAKGIEA
jgi:hypothetical protein